MQTRETWADETNEERKDIWYRQVREDEEHNVNGTTDLQSSDTILECIIE